MSFLKNLSIRIKLFLIFSIVLLSFFGGFAFVFLELDKANHEVETLEHRGERALIITDIAAIFRAKFIQISEYERTGSFNQNSYDEFNTKLTSILEEIESRMETDKQQELYQLIAQNNRKMDQAKDQLILIEGANQSIMEELNKIREETAMAALELSDLIVLDLESAGESAKAAISHTKVVLIVAISIAIVIGTLLVIFFSSYLSKSLNRVAETADNISKGNLQIEKINVNSKDEIGRMSDAMNKMVDQLRDLIFQISSTSDQVAVSAEQLTASAEETSTATDSITNSIQEVASGAERQAEGANSLTEVANEISNGMGKIAHNMDEVHHLAGISYEKANEGTGVIMRSVEHMKLNINEKTMTTSEIVKKLGDKSTEIGNIINLITDVAEQTNLLALNAAIEAARAGEHGKGFAVVADEVRKLAEQSSQSAGQIGMLINDIQKGIHESVLAMDNVKQAVEEGIVYAENAGDSFEGINGAIDQVLSQIQEVAIALHEVTVSSDTMISSVNEMTEITKNSASNSQNVASSAEEQNASMQEITASAETLSQMAEELQNSVKRFTV
ncbi:methyl-accepting chemotaxis protein [Alkalihalobacillus sp. BA299]|uniref:methyl-accepting chemotaxis protein n=1 Tax=Alkalihalobacillus sp. BA299 TaxID=2815938 RepID=UPI001ADBCA01|nr:HAMP domain-containing methyl-accepting chemotaxis protein [Alkalihalobacillus sp. BA299]